MYGGSGSRLNKLNAAEGRSNENVVFNPFKTIGETKGEDVTPPRPHVQTHAILLFICLMTAFT